MKIKTLLLLAVITLITSCQTNDSLINITNDDLEGVWNVTNLSINDGNFMYTESGKSVSVTASATGKNYNATGTFSQNPNNLSIAGTMSLLVTFNYLGQSKSEEIFIDNLFGYDTASWSLDNNVITLTLNGESINLEVIDFTGDLLKLKTSVDFAKSNDKASLAISGFSTITLEK